MAVFARRNLLIAAFGPNILLTQPLSTGHVSIYDADKKGFVNTPISDVIFNNLEAGPNINITQVDGKTLISASSGGAGGVLVVANIAARDALIPSFTGDSLVFVQTDTDGEYSMYLWDYFNTTFKKIATQDSAETDAKSLSYTLNWNSSSTITLGNISAGGRVVDVSIRVITPFNGTPLLTVGDDINGVAVHMDSDINDLTVADQYISESNFTYLDTLDTDIKAYFNAGGATVGQAQIIVSYV